MAEPVYTKAKILTMKRFRGRRDLLYALLDSGRSYTIAEAERKIECFMSGKEM